MPPQAPEIEQAVLGALLLEPVAFEAVEDILRADDFYLPANRLVFQAMTSLRTSARPVDMLTVTEELNRRQELAAAGGPFYISQLASLVASSAHIGYHARVVRDKSDARRLIRIASEVMQRAYDPAEDIAAVVEHAEELLTGLATGNNGVSSASLEEVLQQVVSYARQQEELRRCGQAVAIPTGLPLLDKHLSGGFRPTDLIVLGGRPSMGKTQLSLAFIKAAARSGKHVLMASIEMAERMIGSRYLLEDERIDDSHLHTGQLSNEEWQAVEEQTAALRDLPVRIASDHQICHLHHIRSEARRLKRRGELDMLVIDHLGRIRTGQVFSHRYLEIGYITGELKNLAKELDIPVLLLSQLSRLPKGAVRSTPQLEDLRESGDIEQDADLVLLLHRPDYYVPDAIDSKGVPWAGRGKIVIAKHREGVRNTEVIFYYDERFKKVGDRPFR